MGKIVVMLAFVYLYFNVNEFLVPAFKMKKTDADHLLGLFRGEYSRVFWFAIIHFHVFTYSDSDHQEGQKTSPRVYSRLH